MTRRSLAWLSVLALALTCILHGSRANAASGVTIGSKRFTESFLLGELLKDAATRANAGEVRHTKGLGGTAIVFGALEAGEIDVYPEYTGTLSEAILHLEGKATVANVRQGLASRGLCIAEPLGFQNTYALAVRASEPKTAGLTRIGDLAAHRELAIGITNELAGRRDGWEGLSRAYGLPQTPRAMDHGLAYEAAKSGAIDVVEVYSTDAKIERFGLRVLEDDRAYFPPYEAVYVYRCDLRTRAPGVLAALEKLSGTLDAKTMIALNAEVEIDGRAPEDVVRAYVSRLSSKDPGARAKRASFGARLVQTLRDEGPAHLELVFVSLFASVLIGVPLGVMAERVKRAKGTILGVVSVVQTIPSLALLCFLIPLLGIGKVPTLVALFLYGLLPIVQNTYQGLVSIPRSIRESAIVAGLDRWERLTVVELPLASRAIVAGIRTSAITCVGTATVAAFVGAGGFGQPISTGLNLNDTPTILLGALPAAALALVVGAIFSLVDKRLAAKLGAVDAEGSE